MPPFNGFRGEKRTLERIEGVSSQYEGVTVRCFVPVGKIMGSRCNNGGQSVMDV